MQHTAKSGVITVYVPSPNSIFSPLVFVGILLAAHPPSRPVASISFGMCALRKGENFEISTIIFSFISNFGEAQRFVHPSAGDCPAFWIVFGVEFEFIHFTIRGIVTKQPRYDL